VQVESGAHAFYWVVGIGSLEQTKTILLLDYQIQQHQYRKYTAINNLFRLMKEYKTVYLNHLPKGTWKGFFPL
jgi:hypothetical protein